MSIKKIIAFCVLLFAPCSLLTGCSKTGSKSVDKSILHWNEKSELQTLDTSKAADPVSLTTINNTMEGLYRTGVDSRPEPGLAYKVKISKDSLNYVFYLRNARWSNGDKVTASDFVYSWRRTVSSKVSAPYAYLFDNIKNGYDVRQGRKPLNLLGVKAQGNTKLVVTLQRRIPYFKELMGFPTFFPQNKKLVKKFGLNYGSSPSSVSYNGPFQMTSRSQDNTNWKLKKNGTYWDHKYVKLDGINFAVVKNGQQSYNLFKNDKSDIAILDSKKKNAITHSSASVSYIEFNQTKKYLQNTDIRNGLSLAINRKKLVQSLLKNEAKVPSAAIPSNYFYYPNSNTDFAKQSQVKGAVKYSPQKARLNLKKGLKKLDTKKLVISILSTNYGKDQRIASFIAKEIESTLPSTKVSVQAFPMKEYLKRKKLGQFDLVISSHRADFHDPITFLNLFTSDSLQNSGSWQNSEFDKLIMSSKFKDGGHPERRWNDLVQAELILMNEQGVAPLYQEKTSILLNNKLHGTVYNEFGVNYNFKHSFLEK